MSVLSDRDILDELEGKQGLDITPLEPGRVQPASVDITLGDEFISIRGVHGAKVSVSEGHPDHMLEEMTTDSIVIAPGGYVLGTTVERVEMPDYLTASVEPRSSAARCGLFTDGWVDPGFEGQVTLELANVGMSPIVLDAGESYCQLVFEETRTPAETPYGETESKFQGQTGTTAYRQD